MVAEGVETEEAYAELARLGCDQAQGYYLSRTPRRVVASDRLVSVNETSSSCCDWGRSDVAVQRG